MTKISFNFSKTDSQQQQTHKVKQGETLYSIAKATGVPVNELRKINGMKDNTLSIGQVLRIPPSAQQTNHNEIIITEELSDEQININNTRAKYINTRNNPDHILKSGENPSILAKKYNVEEKVILLINGLNEQTAKNLQPGQVLKIPQTRTAKNVNNLTDVAKAMGVSLEFIKKLKEIEDGTKNDGKPYHENEFHDTPYVDEEGNATIGIGHLLKSGDKQKLSKKEILEIFVNDMLKMEENLWHALGRKQNYDRLPQSIKESLLDMTFNKGTAILQNSEGLIWALKNGRYEGAICRMTNNKSLKGNELSGLSKRRLFDISTASKMYGRNIPQSIINTAQRVYNRGVELLRQECKQKGKNIEHQLVGYNAFVKKYMGDKIKTVNK